MKESAGLFKYLDPSKLLFFENCLVLLTPPIYLNDPWDFLPKVRVPTENEILKAWQENERDIALSSVIVLPTGFTLRAQQDRLKMTRERLTSGEIIAGQGEHYQREISRMFGIVSLTEDPLSRLMWAHYAQSHTGFVVELAAFETDYSNGFVIRDMGTGLSAAKVKYPPSPGQIALTEDASNVLEVCCTKHPLWGYEKEWRIVAPLRNSIFCRVVSNSGREKGKRFCVPFSPGNILRVIFGMRMSLITKQRLCAMLGREEFKNVLKQTTAIDPETGEHVLKTLDSP